MPFCTACGSKLEDGATFCSNCGNATSAGLVPSGQATPSQNYPAPSRRRGMETSDKILIAVGVVTIIFVVGIIILVYEANRYSKRCVSCGGWGATVFKGQEEIGRKSGYMTVTRHDTTSYTDSDGQMRNATTSRNEQVHAQFVTYLQRYGCKYCGYEWTKQIEKAYEG